MTHWEPPVWNPPVVGGDRTTTTRGLDAPRLPPAVSQPPPTPVALHLEPASSAPAPRPPKPVALVPPVAPSQRPRVPVWIRWGIACVAVAGAFTLAAAGDGPGGVSVTGAQPSGPTIVVPATTAPPTTAGTPPATVATAVATTIAVQQLLPQPVCHPSYSPCVPVADDVDCAGGDGDGPTYVSGPIVVSGVDDYRLDGDGDGIACEP